MLDWLEDFDELLDELEDIGWLVEIEEEDELEEGIVTVMLAC